LQEIHFSSGDDYVDSGAFLPTMEIHAVGKTENYIGSLMLDDDTVSCLIGCKMEDRKMKGLGATFGALGATIEALGTNYGIIGLHRLRIDNDENHKSSFGYPLMQEPVILIENPGVTAITQILRKK
jgi:hypothetical protein